jgi:hypothetical protein
MPELESLLDIMLEGEGVLIDPDGREALLTALRMPAFAPSLRGAKRTLALAAACCRADGRDRLFRKDVEAAFTGKSMGTRLGEDAPPGPSSCGSGDPVVAPSLALASLNEMAKSGNVRFETAKEHLREILIESAMKRFDGNKKKVAEVLGASRQTIYESIEG